MEQETLADHLRRATRNFTTRLPEDRVFAIGHALAVELARAHAENPPRHPDLDPGTIPMTDGTPHLTGGGTSGDAGEDVFRLGCLLSSLALGSPVQVSWRLDGPPPVEASTVRRRAVLAMLAAPRRADRYGTAEEAGRDLQVALTPSSAAAGWPLFRGDAARTGARPAAPASAPIAHLRAVWRLGAGAVVGSPVLTGDLVIVPSTDGRLLFIDRARGRLLHAVTIGASECSPTLVGGVLHVGTDDGALIGIDVATGGEVYRARLGGLVRTSPLPSGDAMVVGTVDAKGGGAAFAIDAKGKTVWTRKLGAVFSSAALAGSRVLCGSDEGALHALEGATGAILWSAKLGAKVRATPALSGETAIVGAFDGTVRAVRLADGTEVWSRALGHAVYSSACLTGTTAVLGCHEGHLHGLDLATGAVRFETLTRGPVVSSPSALGAHVVGASTDGSVYLLDDTGAVLERLVLAAGGIQSSPAVDGAEIAIGSADGVHLLRLDA
jgi:outer membrane protein assembly factor BamB